MSVASFHRLLVFVSVLGIAGTGCTKAELDEPVANGITLEVDSGTVSADSGSLTVTARAYEDGVALLEHPIRLSITGSVNAPEVVVETDATTGAAVHTFTGLTVAGSATVSGATGEDSTQISDSLSFTVVHGAIDSLSLAVGQDPNADDGSTDYSFTAADAFANPIPDAAATLSTDAPGAVINGSIVSNLRVAGSWTLYATAAVDPAVTSSNGFIVFPGLAAQAKTSLGQSTVGVLDTLDIECVLLDQYGNNTGFSFDPLYVTTEPASTVVKVGENEFQATGFAETGPAYATCANDDVSTYFDPKNFQVVAQTAGNTVVANLDRSVVEAGMDALLGCTELDEYGNPTGAAFVTGEGSTTATGATIATNGTGGFTLSNLVVKGSFDATCTKGGESDSDDFVVVDTTPPVITQNEITGASGPNGVTADNVYSQDQTVTVTVSATDVVALASLAASVDGPAEVVSFNPIFLASGTTVATRTFDVKIDATAETFDTIDIYTQVTDSTGNVAQPPAITITVDPAANLAVATGVTVRTYFEQVTATGAMPVALSTSGASLIVKRFEPVVTGTDDLIKIAAPGFDFTVVASGFVPGVDDDNSGLGLDIVPGGFGGRTLFHSLKAEGDGKIGTLDGATPVFLADAGVTEPEDLRYGTIGGTTGLVYLEISNTADVKINFVDSAGTVTTFYSDLSGGLVIPTATSLTFLGPDILVAEFDGDLERFDSAAVPTLFADIGPNEANDVVVGDNGNGEKVLVAGGGNGTVYRLDTAGVIEDPISTDFDEPVGLSVDAAGDLFVLDTNVGGGAWRIYRVTGY